MGNASNHCHLFFSKNSDLVYCNDVELLQELGCGHNPEEWGYYVDLSKFILKAALVHTGNTHPLTCIAHCPHEGNLQEYGFALESCKLLEM